MHPRDPLGVIADALAHDLAVTITGSTERDVAKRLMRALYSVYGAEGRTTAPHPMAAGVVYWVVPVPTYRAFEWDADGSAAFCLAPEADYKARLERTSRAIHARHGRRAALADKEDTDAG